MHQQRFAAPFLTACLLLTGCAQPVKAAEPRARDGNADQSNVDLPRYPSISPDGSQVAFTWRGDLWKVSSQGGFAQRLTSNPADETLSAWSKDGKRIAFTSTRAGGENIFVMNADGTGIDQLTNSDRYLALSGFGTDESGNEVVTFAAYFEPDPYRSPRPYMVSTKGGPIGRVHDAFGYAPVVSPDGKRVLFTRGTSTAWRRGYRGSDNRDVWLYTRGDKSFKQLTKFDGNDWRPRWIGNDEYVYTSDRQDGTMNLYRNRIGADDSAATRLTQFNDIDVEDFDVSADGRALVFARWNRLYRIDLTENGGKPVEISIKAAEDESDRYQLHDMSRSVSEAALSPDGKTMAVVSYGDVYVRGTEPHAVTHRVTTKQARERDIAWSPDSETLYFVSDESGTEAIYSATVKLTRGEVKKSYEEATHQNPSSRPTTEPTTGPSADESSTPAGGRSKGGEDEADQSRRRGAARSEPGTAPTSTPSAHGSSASDEDTGPSRWSDAISLDVKLVSKSEVGDFSPSPSPDGKMLAFQRGKGDLFIMDLATQSFRPFLKAWSESLAWRWSPDSKRIAYQTEDENNNSDIWIAKSSESSDAEHHGHPKGAVNITRHPDNDFDPRWSADGKILAFRSERVNNEFDVWMVYLDKDLEALTPGELDQYYKDTAAAVKKRQPLKKPGAATKPTSEPTSAPATEPTTQSAETKEKLDLIRNRDELDLDDAYLRLRRMTSLAGNESNVEIAPAGDKFYFTAQVGTARSLYSVDRETPEPHRIASAVNVQSLNFAGDQIVFVDGGRAGVVKLPAGETDYYDIADRVKIDLQEFNVQKFLEASRILGLQYWDETMHGLDWPAVTKKYLELARATRTSDEFDHVANKLIGELNGSHLGINAPEPPSPLAWAQGRLGITYAISQNPKGFTVTSILPDGPADRGSMRLKLKDVITQIDLQPFAPDDTLESALAGKTDREVVVTFVRDGHELAALLTPITYEHLSDLTYNWWRRENAKKVDEWSGGKLGYIHILAMSQPSLDVFERDLYAAAEGKEGLLIDVRNNGGGSTADRLLASIMYPRHAWTTPRGMDKSIHDGYPQDRLFIQRFDKPIDMLCNEKSFSNAEIISHAFQTLKRGTLVGQTTAGGVISTGGTTLLDGTTVRIPGRGWYLPDGTNMELHGAVPEVLVPQTPEDEVKNDDAQLRAAVQDLLKRLK